jgi:excisionase family DNA binding protein
MIDEFLTVQEVADRLRVKVSWVYAHADDLGAYRLGKYLRFSWARVLERISEAH